MRRLLAFLIALAALYPKWALAAIVATSLGTNTSGVDTGNTFTLSGVTASAGVWRGVVFQLGAGRPAPICTDTGGVGDVYTTAIAGAGSFGNAWLTYSENPAAALVSGSITCTWGGADDGPNMSAFQVTGLATSGSLDVTGSTVSGSATHQVTPGANTITPGQANEWVLGVTMVFTTAGTWSADTAGGFTNVNNVQQPGGGTFVAVDGHVALTTALVTSSPMWVNDGFWSTVLWTFKGASAPPPSSTPTSGLLLRGVGK